MRIIKKHSAICLLLALGTGFAQPRPRAPLGCYLGTMPKSAIDCQPQTTLDRMKREGVNAAEVSRMLSAVDSVRPFLDRMWKELVPFPSIYSSPRIQAFYGPLDSACGKADTGNAAYCYVDKTIYYDAIFLAKMAKGIGLAAGTPGTYAGIAIIEHEFGHAVAWSREFGNQFMSMKMSEIGEHTPERENYADCVLGAVTARAEQLGILPDGAAFEARLAAAAGGDWEPNVNDPHGDTAERAQHFNQGYQNGRGGIGYCVFVRRDVVTREILRGLPR